MQVDWPILSVLLWLPTAAGVLLLLIGERSATAARWLALAASAATFAVSVVLWREYDTVTTAMQFDEREPWIGAFNAWYHLGVDGISMPLIVLTAFITPLVVVAGWTVIEQRPAQYLASFLLLEGLMIGASVRVTRGNIKRYLRSMDWPWKRINQAMSEIRDMLANL